MLLKLSLILAKSSRIRGITRRAVSAAPRRRPLARVHRPRRPRGALAGAAAPRRPGRLRRTPCGGGFRRPLRRGGDHRPRRHPDADALSPRWPPPAVDRRAAALREAAEPPAARADGRWSERSSPGGWRSHVGMAGGAGDPGAAALPGTGREKSRNPHRTPPP